MTTHTRLRLNQGIAGVFYLAHNLAEALGTFADEGIEVEVSTSVLGAPIGLLGKGQADLVIGGPMRTLRLEANENTRLINFCSSVRASPWLLFARRPDPDFALDQLVGATVIDFNEAPTPLMSLRYLLRRAGVNPGAVSFNSDLSMTEGVAAFEADKADYLLHSLHTAQLLVDRGKAHAVTDLAAALGPVPWSTYFTLPEIIEQRREDLDAFTRAIYRAQRWLQASPAKEVVRLAAPFYPDFDEVMLTRIIGYYLGNGIWPADPLVPREDIDRFQDVLFDVGWIARRVPYENQVDTGFAERAIAAVGR
jgi:NitT/TauT family transport system substrate-binding protein